MATTGTHRLILSPQTNTKPMEWLNLHTSVLDSPEVIGADPEHRATWLMLLRYCIGQENSGVIQSCRNWKDRKWQQIVRVTQAETQALSDLWTWHGDDLHITHYPLEKEAIVKGGRRGGKAKTQAKTQASRENGMNGGRRKTQAQPQGKTQQKGREGKEKGMEGNGTHRRSAPDECAARALHLVSLYPKKFKQDDALKELIRQLAAGEVDPEEVEAGTRRIVAVIDHIPSGVLNRYVPGTFAFFHGKRWQDDPQTWIRETNHLTNGGRIEQMEFNGRQPAEVITIS